jgi:hypothetical protein
VACDRHIMQAADTAALKMAADCWNGKHTDGQQQRQQCAHVCWQCLLLLKCVLLVMHAQGT